MGKYSKVIKQVKLNWRLAENGWADTYCESCGWTENHDVHVGCDYKFCPGCGGSVEKDRMKYEIKTARREGLVRCEGYYGCGKELGYYSDRAVHTMKFCPYCGVKFEQDYVQRLIDYEEIEL